MSAGGRGCSGEEIIESSLLPHFASSAVLVRAMITSEGTFLLTRDRCSVRYRDGTCICDIGLGTRSLQRRHHALVRCLRCSDVLGEHICRCGYHLQSLVCFGLRLLIPPRNHRSLWTRQSLKTLRYLSTGVVMRGGRYYSTLLVVIESGALYSIALVGPN